MPAPTPTELSSLMSQAALNKGFGRKTFDNEGKETISNSELSDEHQKLIEAMATGISQAWVVWQKKQVVTIPITANPGSPSTAPPGIGLP